MHPNINPANAVTASRYLTLPPFVYFIDRGLPQCALLTIIVCGLLDKLDGRFAVWFNCKTTFGSIFDAITDAICYGFCIIVLAAYGWVPAIPVAGVIGLGTLNTVFRGLYVKRVGRAENYTSYAMERIVAYAAFLVGFGVAGYEVTYFYWACPIAMGIVVAHDAKRMLIDPVPA